MGVKGPICFYFLRVSMIVVGLDFSTSVVSGPDYGLIFAVQMRFNSTTATTTPAPTTALPSAIPTAAPLLTPV